MNSTDSKMSRTRQNVVNWPTHRKYIKKLKEDLQTLKERKVSQRYNLERAKRRCYKALLETMYDGEFGAKLDAVLDELKKFREEAHEKRIAKMKNDLKTFEEKFANDPMVREVLDFCAENQPHSGKLTELKQQIEAEEEMIANINAETEMVADFYRPQVDELCNVLKETLAKLDEFETPSDNVTKPPGTSKEHRLADDESEKLTSKQAAPLFDVPQSPLILTTSKINKAQTNQNKAPLSWVIKPPRTDLPKIKAVTVIRRSESEIEWLKRRKAPLIRQSILESIRSETVGPTIVTGNDEREKYPNDAAMPNKDKASNQFGGTSASLDSDQLPHSNRSDGASEQPVHGSNLEIFYDSEIFGSNDSFVEIPDLNSSVRSFDSKNSTTASGQKSAPKDTDCNSIEWHEIHSGEEDGCSFNELEALDFSNQQ